MRLEHGHDPAVEPGLGGSQGRADLRWVVAVVVDHGHAAGAAQDLEAALDAREPLQRTLNGGERNLEIQRHADRGEGVEHVVAPGNLQPALADDGAALDDLEAARHPLQVRPPRHQIRRRLEPVRDDALLDARDQQLDVRLVQAQDRRAVERHLVDERHEGVADRVEVAVVIEVLGVHGRDDGDRRRQLQERAVGLVGFRHQELAPAEAGVRAEVRHATADHDRRVEATLREHGPDHRRGRGLAVGAGHRDPVLEPHQLGQHLGPRNGRDLVLARRLDLDVVARDRGRIDDHVSALDVLGAVADEDLRPEHGQPLDRVVASLVGAGHPIAEVHEDLGDPRHAAAADSHEVDLLVALKHGRAVRCSGASPSRAS